MNNAVIAHGGGPTAVINASLAGVIEECTRTQAFSHLWGARYGLSGILKDDFADLLAYDHELICAVGDTPGSAIGSSRMKLGENDYDQILARLRERDVRCFFYTGGNGSMDTALQIGRRAREARYELQVIGIPKTIDNDLHETDHTPGYASTAYFFATTARVAGEDNRSLPSPICVLEVLGRNVGWVTAATAFARQDENDAPHLIYFPERPLSIDRIAADVERVYRKLGRVVVAVCEGQLDEAGRAFGADVDRPGSAVHRLASNLGHTLARLLTQKLGVRARAEKPGLLGRCCGPIISSIDRAEARECGRAAARAAAEGHSNVMISIQRDSSEPYASSMRLVGLDSVARRERTLPDEFIASSANDVTPEFLSYLRPLIPPLVPYARL